MEVDKTWLDRQTRIDNLIAKQTEVMKRIETALINVGAVSSQYEGTWLKQLYELEVARQDRELNIIFFTYPASGTKATLEAGTTTFDFQVGTITATDGAITRMSHSLDSDGKDFLRSFFVNTNKAVTIQLDHKDIIYAEEEKDCIGTYQQFKTMTITTTEPTSTFILCCTNPEAILQLVDKSALISGGDKIIYGEKIDTAGASGYFNGTLGGGLGGSDALGDTPVGYVQLYPTTLTRFKLTSVRYYANPTNAVTYQLYLFEQASENDVQNLADMVFDSGSGQADSTNYIAVDTNKLPMDIKLADAGKLYYLVDWTGDPGTTPGYLEIRGIREV